MDIAISYDGFGIKEDMFTDLWDSMDTMAVNILMDHPLRFHDTMRHHPHHYIQFCCDTNHVDYVKKYFHSEVPQVFFLPHAGTGELPIFYLDRLNELPAMADLLLKNDDLRSKLYRRGFEKTRYSFIWKNLVDEVLEKAQMYR